MGLEKWFTARLDRISTPGGDHDLLASLADLAAQQVDADALGVGARLAGRWAEAEAHLRSTVGVLIDLDARCQQGRTRMELGALAVAQGHAAAARAHYAAALADFESLGAVPMTERTSLTLENL